MGTYVFNLGDGADRITDIDYTSGNLDTLRLGAGLTAANTEVVRSGSDLMLRWAGNAGDSVTIKNVFYSSQLQSGYLIESVVFDDGTVWTLDDLMARLAQDGSTGSDTLQGINTYANRLKGLQGNDTLYGGAQADVLEGGAGDDTLIGYAGADSLAGGLGGDTLEGGLGNDTYVFNLGDAERPPAGQRQHPPAARGQPDGPGRGDGDAGHRERGRRGADRHGRAGQPGQLQLRRRSGHGHAGAQERPERGAAGPHG
ncbi:MAG: calcium-binding protein, partial [Hydrogenophaga sp.]|nr:calcium-binding protein [Hydrogenophaga sp.]